jgi:hypothetical protein
MFLLILKFIFYQLLQLILYLNLIDYNFLLNYHLFLINVHLFPIILQIQ